jgi:hypothetical protein
MANYTANSRFAADAGFKTVTRQGVTLGTVTTMATPIRSSQDSQFMVPMHLANRWDLLANELLGDSSLKWILMRHNRVSDPFKGPALGEMVLVPTQPQIEYYKKNGS